MIANTHELAVALRNLNILETALLALQRQLEAENPDLLAATSPTYRRRIEASQAEIAHYLGEHPADVSRLAAVLPPEALAA